MTHHRVVPADLVALRELGPWLREVIRPHVAENWLDLTMSAIELAVQEVAVNIVVHGLGSQPGASFEMTAQAARGRLVLELTDRGVEFCPDAVQRPDQPQEHGYGVAIVRSLTSVFTVRREADTNHTTLVFVLPTDEVRPDTTLGGNRDGGPSSADEHAARVVLSGRVDAVVAPELRARLTTAVDEGATSLEVDLAAVEFLDSAALAALVQALKRTRERGGSFVLVRPHDPAAMRVFELTKLDRVFTFRDSH